MDGGERVGGVGAIVWIQVGGVGGGGGGGVLEPWELELKGHGDSSWNRGAEPQLRKRGEHGEEDECFTIVTSKRVYVVGFC